MRINTELDNLRLLRSNIQHLRDSAKTAEGPRVTKRRLSYETFEPIRQLGAERAADNYHLTSELAKRCREEIKEDFKERRAAVLFKVTEASGSFRSQSQDQDVRLLAPGWN
ncbi:hypothetical protein ANCDUO_04835 [Ancylostoma duodenale]|uniref:Uncharacterized protein n=1 Tax=Ancylostoma duodenale TaxID=51022 RepID=A0A0C2H633_9BILA|nr:hypothetical protein ANCDUO_04835 [Ancylostoma duodenale]